MNKQHFVCTTDKHTAEMLRELGYPELPKDGSRWVFVNPTSNEVVFQGDNVDIHYTDKLTF